MKTLQHILIANFNPLERQLKEKIAGLENFQTPRTAKEFFEVVQNSFKEFLPIPRPFFREHVYSLLFENNEYESLNLKLNPNGLDTARYNLINNGKRQKELAVSITPAYRIPGLIKDIILGRTSPQEKMPLGAFVNEKVIIFEYSKNFSQIGQGKYS